MLPQPIPFSKVTLGGTPTVTSNKHAALSHVVGEVAPGMPAVAEWSFDAKDAANIVAVLRSELLRLRVFQSVAVGGTEEQIDFKINIDFARIASSCHLGCGYEFEVEMQIEGGRTPFNKRYQIDSEREESATEWFFNDPFDSKLVAVRAFLKKLVPDIQAYVAENA